MRNYTKQLFRRSKTAIILYKIFDNWRLKRRVESGNIETIHGSTHISRSPTESLSYIENQFHDYLTYAGISPICLRGKKILELGPGDNLGVAMKFLTAGAASVVCVDRFYSKRDTNHQLNIYKALRDSFPPDEQRRFDGVMSLSNGLKIDSSRLRSTHGARLEDLADELQRDCQAFDFIVSCAVLEEIYDLNSLFAAMDRLLAPGGYMIHKIDLGDYGMFRNQGMHPLTFLTIPRAIYERMASDSGLPNRKRLGYYRQKLKDFGYDARCFVTSVIPGGFVVPPQEYVPGSFDVDDSSLLLARQIKGRLAREFKGLDDDELVVDGLLLVARKRE